MEEKAAALWESQHLDVSGPSVSELIMMYASLRQIAVMYCSCLQTCLWLLSKSSLWFWDLCCSLRESCVTHHFNLSWLKTLQLVRTVCNVCIPWLGMGCVFLGFHYQRHGRGNHGSVLYLSRIKLPHRKSKRQVKPPRFATCGFTRWLIVS